MDISRYVQGFKEVTEASPVATMVLQETTVVETPTVAADPVYQIKMLGEIEEALWTAQCLAP